MAQKPSEDGQYSEAEADRRMGDALRRALTTPHKLLSKFKGKSAATGKPKQKRKAKKTKASKITRGRAKRG